jgi:hypothetical protein
MARVLAFTFTYKFKIDKMCLLKIYFFEKYGDDSDDDDSDHHYHHNNKSRNIFNFF